MNEQGNLDLVRAIYQAFAHGDLPTVLSHFHDDAIWHVVGDPRQVAFFGRREGKAAMTDFFVSLAGLVEALDCMPKAFDAFGEQVLVLGSDSGTVRATGRRYKTDWAQLFTLREGRVAQFREFYDTAAIALAFQPEARP